MVQSGMPYIVSKVNPETDPTWDLCTFSFSFSFLYFLIIQSYFFFFFCNISNFVLEVISQTIIINTG